MIRKAQKIFCLFVVAAIVISIVPYGNTNVKAATYNYLFPVNNGGKIAYVYGNSAAYGGWHDGIDIHSSGDDTIYAAFSGTVGATANSCPHVSCGYKCEHYSTYGNYIRVNQDDGTSAYYGHLLLNSLMVSVGDRVTKGQAIAKMGSSGYSTGKHLHFEVRSGSTRINVNPVSSGGSIEYSYTGYGDNNTTYTTFTEGIYYIKNNSNGQYLAVSGCVDAQKQNVNTWALNFPHVNEPVEFQMNFTKTNNSGAYKLRPELCASRVINSYGNTVSSGCNVNIYDDLGETSEWWYFEKVSGGYVIRNVMNTSCVMSIQTTQYEENVIVRTYSGSSDQIWSVQSTVAYDANGGSGAPSMQVKNYDEALTLSTTQPTRAGHVFLGWSTSPTASYASYAPGGSFTDNAITILYAVWAPATYTVTFVDYNGAVLKTETVPYGGSATPPANPTYTGHAFAYWDTPYTNVTSNITTTAVYAINSYTVTFKDWDGTVLKTQTVTYGSGATAPVAPTKTGYRFTGWDIAYNYVISDLTVTACYSANAYTITFDANGGSCTSASMTVVYDNIYGVLPIPSKDMKSFIGWSPTNSVDDIVSTYSMVTTASNHTLYAVWGDITPISETEYNGHKYILYNGRVSWHMAKAFCERNGGHLVTITSENEQNIINELNADGRYLWLGASDTNQDGIWEWVTGEPFEYAYWLQGEPNYGSGIEMYLGTLPYMWNDFGETSLEIYRFVLEKPIYYTVTFKDWDGTVLKTQTVPYGSSASAPATPYIEGYTFTGWDKAFNNITSNTTVTATYSKNEEEAIADITYFVTLTDNGNGTATIVAVVPRGVSSGKLAIKVSDKLELIAGSLSSVNGAAVNENYILGACVSFSSSGLYSEGTEVFRATYKIKAGAELSVNDFYSPEWNLFGLNEMLSSEEYGSILKIFVEHTSMLGDVTGDGKVNALDAAFVLRYDAGLIGKDGLDISAADVTGDGKINALDAAFILRYDAGLLPEFPAAK